MTIAIRYSMFFPAKEEQERTDRCNWSLSRLGLALLDHFLNELIPIPVSFNRLEETSVQ
jgi:hypothetical protein